MRTAANLLLVLGFCLGTLGAAGFAPEVERGAWAFLLGGLALVVTGGLVGRTAGRASAGGDQRESEERARFAARLDSILQTVRELEAGRARLAPEEIRRRLDELFEGELFELTSRHEELQALLGFDAYARVWDGVATGERLLYRVWTMLTDGWNEQALDELSLARAQLERSAQVLASV